MCMRLSLITHIQKRREAQVMSWKLFQNRAVILHLQIILWRSGSLMNQGQTHPRHSARFYSGNSLRIFHNSRNVETSSECIVLWYVWWFSVLNEPIPSRIQVDVYQGEPQIKTGVGFASIVISGTRGASMEPLDLAGRKSYSTIDEARITALRKFSAKVITEKSCAMTTSPLFSWQ